MATFKSEFQSLAVELFNEFADFQVDFTIKKDLGYDPIADTETKFSETVGAIPIDIKTAENIFGEVTASDIYLVILDSSPVPGDFDASYYCNYDGADRDIVQVMSDAADATYFVRVVI
jgi:hypothetical protein